MAAIDFPNSPAVNDIFTSGSKSWQWDGITWNLLSTVVVNSLTGTANEVSVSPTTGNAVVSFPTNIVKSGTGYFRVTNTGATSAAQTLSRIDMGVVAGSPRIILEDSSSAVVWSIDNFGGKYRVFSSGAEKMNLTDAGDLSTIGTVQGTRLISTIATGTAPLTVSSTTQVNNLNANYVNGCIRPTTAQSSSIASPAASGVTTTPTKWMADLSLPAQANAGRWIVMEKGVFTKTVATDAIEFGMSVDGGSTYFGMARWYGATGNTTWHQTVFGGFNATANTAYTLSSYVYRQSGTGTVSGPGAGDSRFHVIEAWFISST